MKHTLNGRALFLILLFFGLVFSGCFTILNHPQVDMETEPGEDYRSCSDCHTHPYHVTPYDPVYDDYWTDYYLTPWWSHEIYREYGEEEIPSRSLYPDREFNVRDSGISTGSPGDSSPPPGTSVSRERIIQTSPGDTTGTATDVRKRIPGKDAPQQPAKRSRETNAQKKAKEREQKEKDKEDKETKEDEKKTSPGKKRKR